MSHNVPFSTGRPREEHAMLKFLRNFFCATWLAPFAAQAATISVSDLGPNNPAAVFVVGELLENDANTFRSEVGALSKAVVIFQSDGGSVVAGIQIGEIIRLKNFATLVPTQVRCASACALAWLGGARRFMGTDAQIGFHAAYHIESGRMLETGVGNALIGAYLNRIGLPYSAVVYITQAAPQSMTWLNRSEAIAYGIEVSVLDDGAARKGNTSVGERTSGASSLGSRAARFVSAFVSGWSSTNAINLAALVSAYADKVSYYGSEKTRQEILIDKRRFSERWPERMYDVRPASVEVRCSGQICKVTGLVDWQTRSVRRAASASGIAQFDYEVLPSRGAFAILRENGSVVKRHGPAQGR